MDEGTANGHTGSVLTSWAPFWLPRSGARLPGQLLGRKTTQIGQYHPKVPGSPPILATPEANRSCSPGPEGAAALSHSSFPLR